MMEDRPMTWNEIAAELTATKAKLAAAEERAEKAEAEWQWNAEMFRDEREAHAATAAERDALQAALNRAVLYIENATSARSMDGVHWCTACGGEEDGEGIISHNEDCILADLRAASAAKEQEAMRRVVEGVRVLAEYWAHTNAAGMRPIAVEEGELMDALAALDAARQPADTPNAGEEG